MEEVRGKVLADAIAMIRNQHGHVIPQRSKSEKRLEKSEKRKVDRTVGSGGICQGRLNGRVIF
jgi:hypothetical protein